MLTVKELKIKACIIIQTNKLVLNVVNLKKIITLDFIDSEFHEHWTLFEIDNQVFDLNLFLNEETKTMSLSIYDTEYKDGYSTITDTCTPVELVIIGNLEKALQNYGIQIEI